MAIVTTAVPDLWKAAGDRLDPKTIEQLAPTKTHVRDVVGEALKEAALKRDDSIKKRLRLPNGVILRDVMEKTIHWINCFKEVGDNAVQFDPGHAALPWAALRFVLQAMVNYSEKEREILEELELITRLLAVFRQVEKLYLGHSALPELSKALVEAYAAILETLAKDVKFFRESRKARLLKAPMRLPDGKGSARLLDKEQEVFSLTRLVDGSRMLEMSIKIERFAERSRIADKSVDDQKYKAILNWLSKTNYRQHHESLSEMRLPGTGTWLLQHNQYLSWQHQSSSSILLVHGIPGCGKTILCSSVIDEHMPGATSARTKAPVAFFYCSADPSEPDRRDCTNILRSLVRQLTTGVLQSQKIHSAVLAAYEEKQKESDIHGFHIPQLCAKECEKMILYALEDNPATIVIDALDEMLDPRELLEHLRCICDKSVNVLKILITSRNATDPLAQIPNLQHIRVTAADNKSDVTAFIDRRVSGLAKRGNWNIETKDNVARRLCSGAGEMFQWAKLQLSELEVSRVPGIQEDLETRLSKLEVSTLNGLYGSIFDSIMNYGDVAKAMAIHSFSWLLFAQEPLTVDMFLEITASAVAWTQPTPDGLIEICRGLIHIDSQTNFVRIVHESVRVFLHTQAVLAPHLAQALLASRCLLMLEQLPADNLVKFKPAEEPYDYAALYCGQHLSKVETASAPGTWPSDVHNFFFDDEDAGLFADIWSTNVRTTFANLPLDHPQKLAMEVIISDPCSPIFPICAFGLLFILKSHAWPKTFNWNQINSHGHTPLYVATFFGHDAIVGFLLDHHADPNIECGRLGNALQCAAYLGHVESVRTLYSRGADARAKGKFPSALHAACSGSQEEVAIALLELGFDLPAQVDYDTALFELTDAGFARALDVLQAHPLSKAVTSDKKQQQARSAIIRGNVTLLTRLIKQSTFDHLVPKDSLALSALHGQAQMTQFLFDNEIDIEESGDIGTPLRCASVHGHNEICEFLIAKGADVNKNGRFGTALHTVAMRGHVHTAKLLLDSKAHADAVGGHYGTPLQAAAYHGHTEIVTLLLDAGANFHLAGFSKDAIHAAVEGGQQHIVQLLVKAGHQSRVPIDYSSGRAMAKRCGSPPRNILRECSPTKRSAGQRKSRSHKMSLSREVAFASAVGNSVRAKVDPYDPSHGPHPYGTLRIDKAAGPTSLEVAAALGHGQVLSGLLLDKPDPSLLSQSLVAACRHGQRDIVETILNSLTLTGDIVFNAFRASCSQADKVIMQLLLNAATKLEAADDCFRRALDLSLPNDPSVFPHILQALTADRPKVESEKILLEYLPLAAFAGWPEIVLNIINDLTNGTVDYLMIAFEAACDGGHVVVASAIGQLPSFGAMSLRQWNECARKAAQDGYTELLAFVLPRCDFTQMTESFEKGVCLAAGDGLLEILTLLLSSSNLIRPQAMLTKALVIAAKNGHYDVCSFLLSQDTDASQSVVVDFDGNFMVSRKTVRQHEQTWTRLFNRNPGKDERGRMRFHVEENDNDREATKKYNALEACLKGYKRFVVRDEYSRHSLLFSNWKLADEPTHAKTLDLLVDHIKDFKEAHWVQAICHSAEFCSIDTVRVLLAKGANASACFKNRCALTYAASRERSTLPAIQTLIESGAGDSLKTRDLRQVLNAAVAVFDDKDGTHQLFPLCDSVEEIFISGPGAVVHYLLDRLPLEEVKDNGYNLVLLMAAAANQKKLVKLLIERGISCNGIGSYYGTALKASCRFGHTDVTKFLLESGADSSILDGEKSFTALQLAVKAHSLLDVNLLLEHGADTELVVKSYYRDESSHTPLKLAIHERQSAIACALIDAGADVNTTFECYQPVLIEACAWGEIEVVQSILKSDVQMQIQGQKERHSLRYQEHHSTAMHAAIHSEHLAVVQLLLSSGFCLKDVPDAATAPLAYAAGKGNMPIIMALLAAIPDDATYMFVEAVTMAIKHSQSEAAKSILNFSKKFFTSQDLVLLCEHASRLADCSIFWLLSEQLRQLNSYSNELAAVIRHAAQGGHPNLVKQVFGDSKAYLSSIEIHSVLSNAATFSDRSLVGSILEELGQRHELDSERILNSINTEKLQPEVSETILSFIPCTPDTFVQACMKGDDIIVRIGLQHGLGTDSEDRDSRPALHFAAARAHVSTVQLLLENAAKPTGAHEIYGTPLQTVLEACASSSLLSRKDLSQEDRLYLQGLIGSEMDYDFAYRMKPYKDRSNIQAHKVIAGLLLEYDANVNCTVGRFGSALALTALLGWTDLFSDLLARGARISTSRGVLPSPLAAAVESDHLQIVELILGAGTTKSTEQDFSGSVLRSACEKASIPIIRLLLQHGHDAFAIDHTGSSALTRSIEKLVSATKSHAESFREKEAHSSTIAARTARTVVNTLLETNLLEKTSEADLIAACGMPAGDEQDTLLQALLDRSMTPYIPTEGFIELLLAERPWRASGEMVMPWQRYLREKRLSKVTTSVFAAVAQHEMMMELLDYDNSYIPDADMIDVIGTQHRSVLFGVRKCIESLLLRFGSLSPTTSNVQRVLNLEDRFASEPSRALRLMLARKPDLRVTESMLEACQSTDDLGVVLARFGTGNQLVIEKLLDKLSEGYSGGDKIMMLFDHEPSARVSAKVAQFLCKHHNLASVDHILGRQTDLILTDDDVISMMGSYFIGTAREIDHHRKVIELSRKYPGQCVLSEKVRKAVDELFALQKDKATKQMYYDFAGW